LSVNCPALFIAAPASGQGKTSVTAALARLHSRQGKRVRVFKCGPDFLDPQIHAIASGAPCYNVDLWMCGAEDAAQRLHAAAQEADLILVEGVMGLFDGMPSGADLAQRFNISVLAVLEARAMAQTFAAIAFGLKHYRPDLPFAGVLANHVGSASHAKILQDSLPADIAWFGALPRLEAAALPERHLGLLQAAEIDDLMVRLDLMADAIEQSAAALMPAPVEFAISAPSLIEPQLKGRRIAIARDAAFGFIYPANIDTLRALGAGLVFFSPQAGDALPACDAVWLPGGYPELHAEQLSQRSDLWQALAKHVDTGKPLLAECGGMMSLFETLIDRDGIEHRMGGLLPGRTVMQKKLAALGAQEAEFPEGLVRGHTFHYSACETELVPLCHAIKRGSRGAGAQGERVFRQQRLTASYVHLYFPSNPAAVAALFQP
jgi:cobyrinic acid a,c-diamide synthase